MTHLLGTPFYIMDVVDGWSPADLGGWAEPFQSDLSLRPALAYELVRGAALLSKVDWQARGLTGFGRPENFHERQVDRWLAFLERIKCRELPGLMEAAAWLRTHQPKHWSPGVMHGDYQFANVMYKHGAPGELAAIIDWDTGTIGDPLLDPLTRARHERCGSILESPHDARLEGRRAFRGRHLLEFRGADRATFHAADPTCAV